MAGELFTSGTSGLTHYAMIVNSTGQFWRTDTEVFEAYAAGNYGTYDIPLVELGTASRFYSGDFPTAIPPGNYNILYRRQAGGFPGETDPNAGSDGRFAWSGGKVVPLSMIIRH